MLTTPFIVARLNTVLAIFMIVQLPQVQRVVPRVQRRQPLQLLQPRQPHHVRVAARILGMITMKFGV